MSPTVSLVLGIIGGIAAIVLLYIKVLPKSKDGNLNNKFLQFLHDYFHFKKLYIEAALKFLFICASVFVITIGFFLMFAHVSYWGYSQSYFLPGLLLVVLGPIALRISYEMLMMAILLVQNVIDINSKMGASKGDKTVAVKEQVAVNCAVEEMPQEEVTE